MSYDIILCRRRPGQTWKETQEAEEEAILAQCDEPDPPLTRVDLAGDMGTSLAEPPTASGFVSRPGGLIVAIQHRERLKDDAS
jgi:hypothetical protein